MHQGKYNRQVVCQGESSAVEATRKGSQADEAEVLGGVESVVILIADSFEPGELLFGVYVDACYNCKIEGCEGSDSNDVGAGAEGKFDQFALAQG